MDSCYKNGIIRDGIIRDKIIRMLNYDNKKNLVNLTHFSSFELDNNTIWFKTTINDVFPLHFSNSQKALTYFNDINESLVGYYKCKNINQQVIK